MYPLIDLDEVQSIKDLLCVYVYMEIFNNPTYLFQCLGK
jgi:hypothetical protein